LKARDRRGRQRKAAAKAAKEDLKWPFLADLFRRLGLGDIKPGTLKREWMDWKRERMKMGGSSGHP
jgi:hypothetical protein